MVKFIWFKIDRKRIIIATLFTFSSAYLKKIDNVLILEQLKDFNLSQCSDGKL